MMIRSILTLFVLLAYLYCSKDEGLNPIAPDNCDVLSNYIEIRLQYLLKNEQLYFLRFILNDADLYEPQDFDPFSDYIFHKTIELNGSSYFMVYQFEYRDRILYFNEQYGVLSFNDHFFNDHLNVTQYLK